MPLLMARTRVRLPAMASLGDSLGRVGLKEEVAGNQHPGTQF